MDIQVVAFVLEPLTASNAGISLLKKAMIMGADVVGGVPDSDPNPEKYIALIFKTAKEFNADIDLHIDESNDPSSSLLEYYAEKTLENDYEGRVTASHCSSLSAVSDHTAVRIIKKVGKARMNVIANPLTNLYLWGNDGKSEGVTRVKELLEAGVNVVYATDNTMDPFNPLGNANMLLSGLFLAYIEHLGSKPLTILKMGTYNAAKATKIIPNYGIKKGGRADIMVLDAEDPEEAIIKQAESLYVIKNGRTKVEKGVLTSGAKLKIL
jgi:cytosine deaminase